MDDIDEASDCLSEKHSRCASQQYEINSNLTLKMLHYIVPLRRGEVGGGLQVFKTTAGGRENKLSSLAKGSHALSRLVVSESFHQCSLIYVCK